MKHRILPGLLSTALTLSLCALPASALETEDTRMLLETYYVDEIPQEILNLDSTEAILEALNDPYTVYMSAEEYQAFLNQVDGETVVGIGVSIQNAVDDGVQILSILDNSPAQEAGLSAGDRILAVDGVTLTSGMDPTTLIRGEVGTSVTLTIRLHSTGEEKDFTLERKAVTIPIVTYDLVDGDVGYIACDSFGASTSDTVREALEEMGDSANLWVVDLRSNPGGTDTAVTLSLGWFENLLPGHPARRSRPHRRARGGPHQLLERQRGGDVRRRRPGPPHRHCHRPAHLRQGGGPNGAG